jgi:hypothetical protein
LPPFTGGSPLTGALIGGAFGGAVTPTMTSTSALMPLGPLLTVLIPEEGTPQCKPDFQSLSLSSP